MERGEQSRVARVTEDCFAVLIRAFMSGSNPKWVNPPPIGWADETKKLWQRCLMLAANPDCLGAVSIQRIRPALVQAFLDGLSDRPGTQAACKAALKQVEKWALIRDLLPHHIMTGVEAGRPQGQHMPWSEEHIALAERHARADLAQAITLTANTGQRGSDVVRMAPTDIELYQGIAGLNVVQKKTGRELWVPINSQLSAAMATWERRPGPYLRMPSGEPWTRKGLTEAWCAERDSNPALAPLKQAHLVLHGLRATACVRLWRSGAEIPAIADLVGMSAQMVQRYVRGSKQKDNAIAAIIKLDPAMARERNATRKIT